MGFRLPSFLPSARGRAESCRVTAAPRAVQRERSLSFSLLPQSVEQLFRSRRRRRRRQSRGGGGGKAERVWSAANAAGGGGAADSPSCTRYKEGREREREGGERERFVWPKTDEISTILIIKTPRIKSPAAAKDGQRSRCSHTAAGRGPQKSSSIHSL